MKEIEFNSLEGLIITNIQLNYTSDISNWDMNSDAILFETNDNRKFKLGHYQSCCESVGIEEIHGEVEDLLNSPILLAEEVISYSEPAEEDSWDESTTWSFYKLSTIKGSVTIRWHGSSNGYYSETVDFVELKDE